jgi:hypothetical protein
VATEVGLRHLLWRARGAPLIAVMSEALARRIQKAPDLLRRARNQRVHGLAVNDVLEVVLGVRVLGAEAPHIQALALAHVDKLSLALSQRTRPTVIDRRLLAELLVDVSVGEQVRTASPAQLLASWMRQPPQWSGAVSQLVRETLPTLHGDEGRLLAWALEAPETRLRELMVHGAVLTVEAADVPRQAWGALWQAAEATPLEMDRGVLRRTLTRLTEQTLAALKDGVGDLLEAANKLGREALTSAQVQTSRVLPLAFEARCHALVRQAVLGQAVREADIAWLKEHRAAPLEKPRLAVVEAMARMSRYLAGPETAVDLAHGAAADLAHATLKSATDLAHDSAGPTTDLAHGAAAPWEVVAQVRHYQREGAFADLAMMELKRALASSEHYHAEAAKVLAAARERRDAENRTFAEALARGYEANLHHKDVTPLHRLWKRVVAPVWQSAPEAGIFLVVLDGCSYPVFLELLHDLASDGAFPMGLGSGGAIPALSPLPTVTSHARGAIFLGELPSDPLVAETVFRDQEEARTDKARLNQNAALGGRTRKLFLKGDLADGGQALLAALADVSVQVVAAVFNAVDDQIGSSNTGAVVRLTPDDITGFKPALRRALEAGRRVLVTADHGHSPYVDRGLRVGQGKTPRYVALAPGEAAPDGFLELDLGGLGGPPERRAFAWRSGVYLGGPQVGFHGGCALEEMVVPLAWLERDGLHATEPAWWYGSGSAAAATVTAAKAPVPDRVVVTGGATGSVQSPKAAQFSLFEAPPLPLPAEVLHKLGPDERAILEMLRDAGSARASELAERLGKNPGRLNGLMVKLRRTLHEAGLTLFGDDRLPSGETVYKYLQPRRDPRT